MGEEKGELVGFTLSEDGNDRRYAKKKLFEITKGCGVRRIEGREGWNGASAVDDVDGVLRTEG